jgi:hypothetical protein
MKLIWVFSGAKKSRLWQFSGSSSRPGSFALGDSISHSVNEMPTSTRLGVLLLHPEKLMSGFHLKKLHR